MLFHLILTLASLVTITLAGVATYDMIRSIDELEPFDIVVEGFLTVCVISTGIAALFGVWA